MGDERRSNTAAGARCGVALDETGLLADATDLLPDMVQLRRRIHAEPELGLDLPLTQSKILAALEDLDLEISTGARQTSIVATLRGATDGPTLLLRGDMDALPMPEDSGEPFASEHDGVMHACGHDAHVSMLVGAARLLHARRADLRGTVKFFFQPGEEGHHGARVAIEEGLLTDDEISGAFALHVTPNLPAGMFGVRGGPMMASADELRITVTGRGGHASMPHGATDPIPVACEMVTALHSHITRTVDAFDPAVLTVASIHAGTTSNVIPETARLEGTLRTVSERTRASVRASIERVATHVALAHDCTAEIEMIEGYPVTVNDGAFVDFAVGVLEGVVGMGQVIDMPSPVMGAEDWSYVLQQVPGCMAFIGVCPPDVHPAKAPACHSNRMRLHEDAMAVGAAAHTAVALAFLA